MISTNVKGHPFRIVTFLNRFLRSRVDHREFVRQLENTTLVVRNAAERRSCWALRAQSCRRPIRRRVCTGLRHVSLHRKRFADFRDATPRLVLPVSLLSFRYVATNHVDVSARRQRQHAPKTASATEVCSTRVHAVMIFLPSRSRVHGHTTPC
jgi:hypothetical protein